MKLIEYSDRDALMDALAQSVASDLRGAIEAQGWASIAVPGGSTPGPFFDALSKADLDWSKVHVTLGDERFVSEDSPRSNTALLKSRLFQNNAAAATLLKLYQKADEPESVLDALSAQFSPVLPLSVNVLGMGTDMHTASLFPDSKELQQALQTDDVLTVVRPASQPEARLTLSGKVLANAQSIYVLITGAEKKEAIDAASAINDPMVAPISLVLGLPQTKVFYAA